MQLKLINIATVAFFLAGLSACADPHVAGVESYIKEDAEIEKKLGDVQSLSRTRTIVVRAGDQTRAYREYAFIVRGSRDKALVNVRAYDVEDPSRKGDAVQSIDAL